VGPRSVPHHGGLSAVSRAPIMYPVLHAVKIRPVRIHARSDLLEVDTLRGVAYRATCSCEWRGPARARHSEARLDGRDHVRDA
jgi:hypothetical protein